MFNKDAHMIIHESTDRWAINGHAISWQPKPGETHLDHVEMSGQKVALIVTYGQQHDALFLSRTIIYPLLRTIPNLTHANTVCEYGNDLRCRISLNGKPIREQLIQVVFDGVLCLTTCDQNAKVFIERRIWPSSEQSAVHETTRITNGNKQPVTVSIESIDRLEYGRGSKGVYVISVKQEAMTIVLSSGKTRQATLCFSAKIANHQSPPCDPDLDLKRRYSLIKAWDSSLILNTPDPIIDLAFRFAKIHACESIFKNSCGLLHSPGGGTYYAAIWTNDQIEYAAPFFPFVGYSAGLEATINACRLFIPYMGDNYHPIPSSIIAEGQDIWEGVGDRGDAAMYLYGLSRFLLSLADPQIALDFFPALMWCVNYNLRQLNEHGVICSDSDELEERFPSGDANLCTSCLAYGGLVSTAYLAEELNKPAEAQTCRIFADELRRAIECYFGADVEGYQTYRYYDGNTVLRAWLAIPLTMGIFERSEQTVSALFSPRLWTEDGLATQAGDAIFWDRATLYGLRGVFHAGEHEEAGARFAAYSRRRLLGDHVPYPVEAWPEGNQRQLAAESALYCRIITEGIMGMTPTGFRSFTIKPSLPSHWQSISLQHIRAFADNFSIAIERKTDLLEIHLFCASGSHQFFTIKDGESIQISLK